MRRSAEIRDESVTTTGRGLVPGRCGRHRRRSTTRGSRTPADVHPTCSVARRAMRSGSVGLKDHVIGTRGGEGGVARFHSRHEVQP